VSIVRVIVAGALAVGAALVGCNSEESSGTGGASGVGGSGGSPGSGGSGARGGSAGSGADSGAKAGAAGSCEVDASQFADGAACDNNDPTIIRDCKATGTCEGICSSLVSCSCDKCACLLARCQADPGCLELRRCALRTGCCTYALQARGCAGEVCDVACSREIVASGNGLSLAIELDDCVYRGDAQTCNPCPTEGGAPADAAGGG